MNFNAGRIFLRHVRTTGDGRALADVQHTPDSGAACRVTGAGKPGSLGGGGRSEVPGGFSDTTTVGKLAPMLVNMDSSGWAFFNEVYYNNDPFAWRVPETGGTGTGTLGEDGGTPRRIQADRRTAERVRNGSHCGVGEGVLTAFTYPGATGIRHKVVSFRWICPDPAVNCPMPAANPIRSIGTILAPAHPGSRRKGP